MIRTTDSQKAEIRQAINSNGFYRNEKVWTYLVADILPNSEHINNYLKLFCNDDTTRNDFDRNIWFESEPIPPRKGSSGNAEGNTKIDLAFGAIRIRKNTQSGIEYNYDCARGERNWVCFVEAKLFSDCSTKVSYDPLKNQIARVIENLVCFQGNGNFPEKLFFTLLTPRLFKSNPKSRLYGYKMNDYEDNRNVIEDINLSRIEKRIEERNLMNWSYPDLTDRLKTLKIKWITYEEIFEKEYSISELDLTDFKKMQKNGKTEGIVKRLKELANGV